MASFEEFVKTRSGANNPTSSNGGSFEEYVKAKTASMPKANVPISASTNIMATNPNGGRLWESEVMGNANMPKVDNYKGLTANDVARHNGDTRAYMKQLENLASQKGLSFDEVKSYADKVNNARVDTNLTKLAEEHPVVASALSVPLNFVSGTTGTIENVGNRILGRPLSNDSGANALSKTVQNVRNTASEDMGNVGRFFYGAGMSAADMLLNRALGTGAVGLGLEKAENTMTENIDRGMTDNKVLLGGLASGATTWLTEQIPMKKLDAIRQSGFGGVGKDFVKDIVKKVGAASLSEGLQEMSEDIADTIADEIISRTGTRNLTKLEADYQTAISNGMSDSEAKKKVFGDYFINTVVDGLAGAVSGGALAGAEGLNYKVASNRANYNQQNQQKINDAINKALEEGRTRERDTQLANALNLNRATIDNVEGMGTPMLPLEVNTSSDNYSSPTIDPNYQYITEMGVPTLPSETQIAEERYDNAPMDFPIMDSNGKLLRSTTTKSVNPKVEISNKQLDGQINSYANMFLGKNTEVTDRLKTVLNDYEATGDISSLEEITSLVSDLENALKGKSYTTQRVTKKSTGERKKISYPGNRGTITERVNQFLNDIDSERYSDLGVSDDVSNIVASLRNENASTDVVSKVNSIFDDLKMFANTQNEDYVDSAIEKYIEVGGSVDNSISGMIDKAVTQAIKNVNDSNIVMAEDIGINPNSNLAYDIEEDYTSNTPNNTSPVVDLRGYRENSRFIPSGENIEPDGSISLTEELGESKYASDTLISKSDLPDSVKQEFIDNPLLYGKLKNADTKAKAYDILDSNDFQKSVSIFRELLAKRDPVAIVLGYNLAKTATDYNVACDIVEQMSLELTKSGQFTQAAAIELLKGNPMASLEYAMRQISKLNKEGKAKYKKKWTDFELTEDEKNAFKNVREGDEEAIKNLYEQIGNRLAKQYPSNMWEKIVEASKTAMMLNPRTHIRNITSNAILNPVSSLSDRADALVQRAISLFKPDYDVTQSMTGGTKEQKNIAGKIYDSNFANLEKQNEYQDLAKNVPRNKQIFNDTKFGGMMKNVTIKVANKTMDFKMSQALDSMLGGKLQNMVDSLPENMTDSALENLKNFDYWLLGEVEDDPFVKKRFVNRLASYMKAQNITSAENVSDEAISLAWEEALKATFKDSNFMTKALSGVKKSLNNVGPLGDILLPFVTTPANIAVRGLDYSPVGLIMAAGQKVNGKYTDAQVTSELGKGLVGTTGILIGMLLAKAGKIKGALDEDKRARKFQEQQGMLAYSFKIGDKYYTFDWAQPASIPLIIGATIADAQEDGDKVSVQSMFDALTAGANAWSEISPLQTFADLFKSKGYGEDANVIENLATEIAEFPQRLIPAILGAVTRTKDINYRETYEKGNFFQTQLNTAKSKIPGLSETLPSQYDTWGRERKRQDDNLSSAFQQFLYPGQYGYNASTPIDKELMNLYEKTQNTGVFPQVAPYTVEAHGEKKNLTTVERSKYQKIMGQYSYEFATELMKSEFYRNVDDVDKVELLKSVYSLAKYLTEEELFGNDIAKTYQKKANAYKEGGVKALLDILNK